MNTLPKTSTKQPASCEPCATRIIAAARSHFMAHGFRGVTMDDLAAELGMSKKTFYAHFPGKEALIAAVMNEKLDEVESDLERITRRRDARFIDALHELLACLQRHTGEIQPAFLRDIRRHAPDLFAVIETRRAAIIQRCFARLLNAGRKTGMVRNDVPARLIIEMLLGATQAIMNPAKIEELKLTPRAAYSAILDVILRGVMTAKGRTDL